MSRFRAIRAVIGWRTVFCCCLAFAVAVAGWQGWIHYADRNPQPDQTAQVGTTLIFEGVTYRVDEMDVRTEFPAQEPDQPVVRAPDGAVIVLVLVTIEIVDDGVDPETNYCDATLVGADGRTWPTESDSTSMIRRPEASSCTGSYDKSIKRHQPMQAGFSYLIPADVADEVTFWLDAGPGDGEILEFVP